LNVIYSLESESLHHNSSTGQNKAKTRQLNTSVSHSKDAPYGLHEDQLKNRLWSHESTEKEQDSTINHEKKIS